MHYTQLDKERYRVWVELEPDYTGRRRRKSKVIHATTKKELKKKIDEWTASLSPASGTVSDMVEAVWPRILQGKSQNTIIKYDRIRSIIDSTLGTYRLDRLSPRVLQEWVNNLSGTYSGGYVRAIYSRLHQCCSVAVLYDILPSNPCHDVAMPREAKKTIKILSESDFNAFCQNLHTLPPDRAVLFELALFGSLRRGEILGIYEDEIPSDGRFYIQRARYAPTVSASYIKETKTESGERLCVLPRAIVQEVAALREYHARQKEKLGDAWIESPFLIREPGAVRALDIEDVPCAIEQRHRAIRCHLIGFRSIRSRHSYESILPSILIPAWIIHTAPPLCLKNCTKKDGGHPFGFPPFSFPFFVIVNSCTRSVGVGVVSGRTPALRHTCVSTLP